ncbi:MAG: 4-oxalocrotonate tautomerase [Euryarchaeota archaeon]|nr:4-oxalocrotonate tautomerase [Euryarchaeota archaeon]
MPVITIDSPRLTKKQKSDLVESFTKTASRIMELPEESIIILIKEIDSEDVGVGGLLLCDRDS